MFDDQNKNIDDLSVGKDLILYHRLEYQKIQEYPDLCRFITDKFISHFSISKGLAKSLDFSPIGGIQVRSPADFFTFEKYVDECILKLKSKKVNLIQINQAPFFYSDFVPSDWLIKYGFEIKIKDSLQYIDLQNPYDLHSMQKRKLTQKWEYAIRKVDQIEIPEVHSFIAKCRAQNGLNINISHEKLMALVHAFPDKYEAFVLESSEEIASAVIMTLPTANICYYYLPATSSDFKSKSPMVHLLYFLINLYRELGYEYMDLGISSIEGVLQTGLADFKTRMGAQMTDRILFELRI